MNIVHLDFESYYSATYSLSKMTTQEYIMSDEFEAMLISYKVNNEPTKVIVSPTKEDLLALNLHKCVVVAHNAGFDVGILSLRYGIKPAFIFDTLGAARSLGFSSISGCSLDALAKTMRKLYPYIPTKGTAVKRMLGLRMADLSEAELAEYVEYCKTDTDICAILSGHLMKLLPEDEARFQDMVLRCATEPVIEIDKELVESELTRIMKRRDSLQDRLAHVLGSTTEEAMLSIMSNAKFADALVKIAEENGHPSHDIVPWKISAKTGKQTHAFAKTDQAMQDLLEHPVEDIALLAATRLGLKTTTEHTRLQRFLRLAEFKALSVPYNISGAHTHRLSGCVVGDTMITCLTSDGEVQEKPITDVRLSDLVWDGVAFVEHEGVVFSGYQDVYEHDGIIATAEHEVFTSETTSCGLLAAKKAGTGIMTASAPSGWEYNAGRLRKLHED
jgi:hypothetical protein